MRKNWLWDRKISADEAKRILKDPENRKFCILASALLMRKNEPKEVFGEYIAPLTFCRYWPAVKKKMRKDKWAEARIVFWQAIYEKLMEKYRKEGVSFRKKSAEAKDGICRLMGKEIRNARTELELSQMELAEKMGVSQQLVSRIEKGRENISLMTLKTVADALGRKAVINLERG